jgi:hypothetical protein
MVMVVGVLMQINDNGALEFLTVNEKQLSLLLALLRRTVKDGRGISNNKSKIAVERGRFLYTKIGEDEQQAYLPYMSGKGFYGLNIVDDGMGDLVFMLMDQGNTHAQADELNLLEELGRA